jgi:hypothetical protein
MANLLRQPRSWLRVTFGASLAVAFVAGCINWEDPGPAVPLTPTSTDAGGDLGDAGTVECTLASDCVTPGTCQVAADAHCVEGKCEYAALACNTPPASACNTANDVFLAYAFDGTCEPSTGKCQYASTSVPCANCSTSCAGQCEGVVCNELHSGCRKNGTCVPGFPPSCQYQDAPESAPCDGGFCTAGACVECTKAAQCDDKNPCTTDSCTGNVCAHVIKAGNTCDDGNACTHTDKCQSNGSCVGTSLTCQSDPGPCGVVRTCNGTSACAAQFPDSTISCDDGAACTHTDRCDGAGACKGTALTCTSDTGPCGKIRKCDGTATCATGFPSTSVSCDDGAACTHTDRCDGAGGCKGTALTCTSDPGPCGVVRACNGTSTCATSFPGTTVTCDDGAACTHTDRCNGSGQCKGTPLLCVNDPGPCGLTRSCNGTSTCTTRFPGTTVTCSDGASCTHTDHCNGSGQCVGTAYTCTSTECTDRSCNGAGGCTSTINVGLECGECGNCNSAGTCTGQCTQGQTCCGNDVCVADHQSCP